MSGVPGLECLWATPRKLLEIGVWYTTQSQEFVKGTSFPLAVLLFSLFGQLLEFFRISREFFVPRVFVGERFNDLRSDRILFL